MDELIRRKAIRFVRRDSLLIHYWGKLHGKGKRLVAPCSPDVNEESRCTSNISRITCPDCLRLLRTEDLH